jgi:hypothetical protein
MHFKERDAVFSVRKERGSHARTRGLSLTTEKGVVTFGSSEDDALGEEVL